MRIKLLSLIIMGYGLTIEYIKDKKNHNPKRKNYNSDGSIEKFNIYTNISHYSDFFISFTFLYNYSIVIRLHMNRE